jgi:hypothetical protein
VRLEQLHGPSNLLDRPIDGFLALGMLPEVLGRPVVRLQSGKPEARRSGNLLCEGEDRLPRLHATAVGADIHLHQDGEAGAEGGGGIAQVLHVARVVHAHGHPGLLR